MAANIATKNKRSAHSQLKGIVDFGKCAYMQSFQESDDKINTISKHEGYQSFHVTQQSNLSVFLKMSNYSFICHD